MNRDWRFKSFRFGVPARWGIGCAIGVCLLAGGCGQGPDDEGRGSQSEAAEAAEGSPLTAPADYLGAVNQAQKSSANRLALAGLQQAIQQFRVMEDRHPNDLNELVGSEYLPRLPEVPKAFVFHYDRRTGEVQLLPAPEENAGGGRR